MSTGVTFGNTETFAVNIDTDLSGKEGYLVALDGTDARTANLAAAATAPVFILAEGADGSDTATNGTIITGGIAKVKIGDTVAPGDRLTANASGEAIATTTVGDYVGAIALDDGADGDVIAVKVVQFTLANAA